MSDILEKIIAEKRKFVEAAKTALPLDEIQRRMDRYFVTHNPDRDFCARLRREKHNHIRVIGEIKRASPSKGKIADFASPLEVARKYRAGNVEAISVLTDEPFFLGKLEYLDELQTLGLPLLRKDFIIDDYQLYESIVHGADAVLLIVAVLKQDTLRMAALANQLGIETLVEVHDQHELDIAVQSEAPAIGVNCRNLRDFSIDLRLCEELLPRIPAGRLKVAESGIFSRSDARRMEQAGADAILVGESLMTTPDPGALIRALKGETH